MKIHDVFDVDFQAAESAFIVTVKGLAEEGYIDEDYVDDILSNYSLTIAKRNWFVRVLGRFWKNESEGRLMLRLVKFIHHKESNEDHPEQPVEGAENTHDRGGDRECQSTVGALRGGATDGA